MFCIVVFVVFGAAGVMLLDMMLWDSTIFFLLSTVKYGRRNHTHTHLIWGYKHTRDINTFISLYVSILIENVMRMAI